MSAPNGFDRRAALGELFYGVLKQTKLLDADDILVLDGGRVVDEGTHTQLLQTSPLYRNLAHTQLLSQPA